MEIKLTKKPEEVYWKTTTEYELEVSGKPITIRIEEDSNGIEIWYRNGHDEKWTLDRPDWIIALDENGVLGQFRDQFEVGKVINTEEGDDFPPLERSMKIEFKGVRKYFSDQEVRSFVVVFDLGKFLQSYPGFSDKLTAEKIVNGASSFNKFADYVDPQSESSTPGGILYYLMELVNSDSLLLELIPDKSNPGEILDYMDAFPDFDFDFFEEVSGEVLPTNLEQYWMIESIKAL